MYSRLDPVFQAALPRQTESTDTRQGIRHEEKTDDRGRKDKGHKDEESPDIWEDSTIVSVRALDAFLAGLVATAAQNEKANSAEVQISRKPAETAAAPPAHENKPVTEAARAAKAYKSMYYTGQKEHQPPLPAPPAGDSSVKLSAEEMRVLHKLMADINILAARGIETLQIRKSDSFLQSLVDAAALALRS